MRQLANMLAVLAACLFIFTSAASAVERDVRVAVPDVPGGVIVSNCYAAVGNIYDKYSFSFCLKHRGTYSVRGGGLRCDGRLNWNVAGVFVDVRLSRTSCNKGMAWTADTMTCRPSLVLGFIAGLLKEKRPLLDNLVCEYTPAKGTGHKKISFIAHRR
ncbi:MULTISPECIES: hypothetical protein [unclassified Devosia]|uniref:hypothetical protein n=1 Tax=unclassified Devosia TaxID=196773 RepID=UPI001ACF526A|nr:MULTISPECIES: hypothetical protein [unclassified Devosia]MBN9306316.1 hypothetical protein [Devosia sp.]